MSEKFCVQLSRDDPLYQMKAEVLQALGWPTAQSLPLRRQGWPTVLLPYIAFVRLTPQNCGAQSAQDAEACRAALRKLARSLLVDRKMVADKNVDTDALARVWLAQQCALQCTVLDNTKKDDAKLEQALIKGELEAVPEFESAAEAEVPQESQNGQQASAQPRQRRQRGAGLLSAKQERYIEAALAAVRLEEGRILRRTQYKLQETK